MLTRLRVRNFKKLDMDVPLGRSVVFVGPNNSGKTTGLQALTLWDIGLRQWVAKRGGKARPEIRPGVAINRQDLISIPVPSADLLWKDLHVRNVQRKNAKTSTQNIRIDIVVEGVVEGNPWSCGLEFDYSNEESFICRPIRQAGFEDVPVAKAHYTKIPPEAQSVKVAYLPPMSGLAAIEPKWELGRINVLLGEGQTAQVLRNLCFRIYNDEEDPQRAKWEELNRRIDSLFGVTLQPPRYLSDRGEIAMGYKERSGVRGVQLDLSASGRGLQQTLLLLAHLYANPKTVLLLDEPDAHLEILRQRQIYQILIETAESQGSQFIAASHSEIVLNEAGTRGQVIAFVGKPHALPDRPGQLLKSLSEIGFDQYLEAEQTGWVLYLESASDLAILREFARLLGHDEATQLLERPFVKYVANNTGEARSHFRGLSEAKTDLVGIAIYDRLPNKELPKNLELTELMWARREIENYFCTEDVLLSYAKGGFPDDLFLFAEAQQERRQMAMLEVIRELVDAQRTVHEDFDPWSPDAKATDDVLDPMFRNFFKKLGLPLTFRKVDYCELVKFLPPGKLDSEIKEKLDAIVAVAKKAKPRSH